MSPAVSITNCVAVPVARATPVPPASSLLRDNLLRIFGGDRVAGLMNAFRVEEDMPIESGMYPLAGGGRRRWRPITTTSASRCSSTTR